MLLLLSFAEISGGPPAPFTLQENGDGDTLLTLVSLNSAWVTDPPMVMYDIGSDNHTPPVYSDLYRNALTMVRTLPWTSMSTTSLLRTWLMHL